MQLGSMQDRNRSGVRFQLTVYCIGGVAEIYIHLGRYRVGMINEGSDYEQAGSSGTENPAIVKLTPERARLILQEHGMEVSLDQADAILAFLRRLASICNSNHSQDG